MDPLAWTKLTERPAYSGFVRIRVDTYRTPDGSVSEWDVLEQRDTVCVLAFTREGRALVFEQFRVGPARPLPELPGGLIDDGEDPVTAGLRELREETGYVAGAHWDAGAEWAAASSTRRRNVLVVADCVPAGEPEWDEGESGIVREVDAADLVDALLAGEMSDAGPGVRALVRFARAEPGELPEGMGAMRETVRRLLLPH